MGRSWKEFGLIKSSKTNFSLFIPGETRVFCIFGCVLLFVLHNSTQLNSIRAIMFVSFWAQFLEV